MNAMSIDDQIASMRATWPQFKVRSRSDEMVTWVGPVEAEFQTFTVEIKYAQGDRFPWVRVLRPALRERPDFRDGPLPHVYWRNNKPFLCLCDPEQDDWNAAMAISQTTVKWVSEWLYFYEIWSMTGNWLGGGRHPGQPVPVKPELNEEAAS
jgi:hypothetical protein